MATSAGPTLRPFQASIHATLSRTGVDTVEEIDYDGGQFTRRFRVLPGPGVVTVLNDDQLRELLVELRTELRTAPTGIDLVGVEVFTDLIEDALRDEPAVSSRFDGARFGGVTRDATHNVLLGHVDIGIDLIGTVRDLGHELSFEQHLVVLGPGPFRPLSPADRASLAEALRANPPADPLWRVILEDASRETARIVQEFVRQRYPELVAAGGRATPVSGAALSEVLPRFDVYSFAAGSEHPLTRPPLARRTILVDRGERQVVLDLDAAAADATVAAAIRGSAVLPAADLSSAPKVATVVALLAPLDPFWSNPAEGGFQATAAADGSIQAVWSGDAFRYEVDFAKDGTVAGLTRTDGRIKPL